MCEMWNVVNPSCKNGWNMSPHVIIWYHLHSLRSSSIWKELLLPCGVLAGGIAVTVWYGITHGFHSHGRQSSTQHASMTPMVLRGVAYRCKQRLLWSTFAAHNLRHYNLKTYSSTVSFLDIVGIALSLLCSLKPSTTKASHDGSAVTKVGPAGSAGLDRYLICRGATTISICKALYDACDLDQSCTEKVYIFSIRFTAIRCFLWICSNIIFCSVVFPISGVFGSSWDDLTSATAYKHSRRTDVSGPNLAALFV